jgi:hypothetical protein
MNTQPYLLELMQDKPKHQNKERSKLDLVVLIILLTQFSVKDEVGQVLRVNYCPTFLIS